MLFATIGPSGAGKNTICDSVFKEYGIARPITTTTRKMRKGESQGNPHYFVDKINEEDFKRSPAADKNHRGAAYWTTIEEFNKSKHVHRDLSRKGVKDAIEYFGKSEVVVIYIYATYDTVFSRLIKRDGGVDARNRMTSNMEDQSFDDIDIADYCIINKDLEKSKSLLRAIINLELKYRGGNITFR